MRLDFLGDALDHWKGSLFESLCASELLLDFAADPMASDQLLWKPADFNVYAGLLRIAPGQIIRHRVTLRDRVKYFNEISHRGDLFLDPDTGVATGRVKEKHVSPLEIGQLLDDPANRLLVTYQHSARGKSIACRVDEVMDALERELGPLRGCSYESPTVAMLFLARVSRRIVAIEKHFRSSLGLRAEGRIRVH